MRRVSRILLLAAALSAVPTGAGCARKAPGPDECLAFAYRVVGVRHPAQLEFPRVRARVDDLTRKCLVTPYDRKLLRCVELGIPAGACMREFDARVAASNRRSSY